MRTKDPVQEGVVGPKSRGKTGRAAGVRGVDVRMRNWRANRAEGNALEG